MKEIIRSVRPQVTLEVGCAYGVSSRYICEALQEVSAVKHIAMDPYQYSEFEGIGLANLKRAGCLDIVGSILLEARGIVILDDLSWPPIRSVCRYGTRDAMFRHAVRSGASCD